MQKSSTGHKYALKEYEYVEHYVSCVIPSKIMTYQSYPESLVNQNAISVDLLR